MKRRVGIVGSLVWDVIHGRDPLAPPVEEWGGIAYALAGLDASLSDDWEIVPLIKVGRDLAPRAAELLGTLSRLAPGARCVEVDAPNNPPQSLSKVEDQRFPPVDAIIPTDEEMERQRLQLEAEVRRFAQQADYLALALAGDTPHQIEMRRHREQERKARDERRIAAVEARLESMVAREHQREARFDERRQRHAERTHRSSVSPSPEGESDTENESKNDAFGGDTVGQLA